MKIAVFHNYLDNIGGAEIVALTLARELSADIYTTNIAADKIAKMGFADVLGRIYSIGHLPQMAPFRQQLAFWKFRRLNLSDKYDFFIIAGDWAMSAAVNNRPNLWYAHSPLNELWQFKDFIRRDILSAWKVWPYDIWVWFNRKLTRRYARSIDVMVANSENTKKRIKRFYGLDAMVINPPVYTKDFKASAASAATADYWLAVNRLITHKRLDLQLKAFSALPEEKLIMVGSYEKGVRQFENYKKYLETIRPDNVKIINWVDDQELKELYHGAKGFVTTARDEDFGLTAVEAMAAGLPVIASAEGGYLESVIDGATGFLIKDINSSKLAAAISAVGKNLKEDPLAYREACSKRAADFDTSIFIAKIKDAIWKNHSGKKEECL